MDLNKAKLVGFFAFVFNHDLFYFGKKPEKPSFYRLFLLFLHVSKSIDLKWIASDTH